MDVAKPPASLFELSGVLSQLSATDREKVESEAFRSTCLTTFSNFMDADGVVPEENTAQAVLACVPEERQPVLGLTAETAAAFLCHFGVTASSIASDVYLRIAQWAEAERTLELCHGPVVPAVLPAGNGIYGVEAVEQGIDRIEALAKEGETLRAGDLMWVQKIAEKCLPDINPTSYRTCQQQAAKVVPTVLRCAVQSPAQRSQLLDAVARIAAGSRPAGEKLAKAPAFREVLEITLSGSRADARGNVSPATDVHAALQACASVACQDFGAAALKAFVPTIAGYALAEHVGTFATIQAGALSVLAQLCAHEALKPVVAASLTMTLLVRLLSGHRAMERRDDRFDFQLLCVQLLGETTADGCRVADMLEDIIAQGAPANLVEALDAAVKGEEYPLGSRCFRRPAPLVQCIIAVARAGKAAQLRGARSALRALLDDEDTQKDALEGLRALAASRRCAEELLGDEALLAALEDIAADERAFGEETRAGDVLVAVRAKVAENPPVYETHEFAAVLGGQGKAVQFCGPALDAQERLLCTDADDVVERLLEFGVIVWDGDPPAAHRHTGRPEDLPNLSTAFTQVIERALLEAEYRQQPLVAAGFCGADVDAAQKAWADLAKTFPGRVVLFGSAREGVPVAAMPDLVRAVSGLTEGSHRSHRSLPLPDSSTAAPSVASEDFRSVASLEPAFESAGLRAVAPTTVISIGLTGAAKADFARMAAGQVSGPEEWIVYSAFAQHPKRADVSLAEWGGMQLTERCVLSAATREVSSANGEWTLTLDAEGEWQLK